MRAQAAVECIRNLQGQVSGSQRKAAALRGATKPAALHAFRPRRAQAAVEYIFVLSLIVGFTVAVMVPASRELEFGIALAASRAALLNYAASHPEVGFASVGYTVQGRTVTLNPLVYDARTAEPTTMPDGMKADLRSALQSVLAPSRQAEGNCAQANNYEYCVT